MIAKRITMAVLLVYYLGSTAFAELDIVSCREDASCTIKIYRSDQPILLDSYRIYMASETVGADQKVEMVYDNLSNLVSCDGYWHNLASTSGRSELQNQIRCDVDSDQNRIVADFVFYDQKTYDTPYNSEPGESGYPTVTGTSESSPHCESEGTIASACVWQEQKDDHWIVFGKTTVTDMYFAHSVPEGTSNEDYTPSNICMEDTDGNESYSANEFGVCSDTPDGDLCLLDAVSCTETTSTPICPDDRLGNLGFLNTESDRCEDTPKRVCTDPSAVWDETLQKCIVVSQCLNICPDGYSYESSSGKCVGSPCDEYSTFNSSTNRCETIISFQCPLTENVYSSKTTCDNACNLEGVCEADNFRKITSCYTYGGSANCSIPDNPFSTCETGTCSVYNSNAAQFGYPLPTLKCSSTTGYTHIGSGKEVVRNFYTSGCSRSTFYNQYWAKKDGWISGYVCSTTGEQFTDFTMTYMGQTSTISGLALCEALCTSETQACTSYCAPGYSLVSGSNLCVRSPLCSFEGTLTAEGTCELAPNYESVGCLVDPDQNCAEGYAYSPDSGLCEAYPICESGAYRPETNDCYEGNNTCPYGDEWPCMAYDGGNYCSQLVCIPADDIITNLGDAVGANDKTDDGVVDEEGNCIGQIYIFNGSDKRCRDWGLTIAFANCCQDDDYLFGLNQCKEEEIQLSLLKGKGLCHKVGNYCSKEISLGITDVCIETSDSHCCFNSKLARIIHEQGRPQIQGFIDGWGDADSPQCRGFTPEEFQMLDFSKINLDEWIGDIQVTTQQSIASDISSGVNEFYQDIE